VRDDRIAARGRPLDANAVVLSMDDDGLRAAERWFRDSVSGGADSRLAPERYSVVNDSVSCSARPRSRGDRNCGGCSPFRAGATWRTSGTWSPASHRWQPRGKTSTSTCSSQLGHRIVGGLPEGEDEFVAWLRNVAERA
jgi:hypothetical protein